jgi:hypothetical protein
MTENFPEQDIDEFCAPCGDFLPFPSGTVPKLETMFLLFAEALKFGYREILLPVHEGCKLGCHLAVNAGVMFVNEIATAHGF